MPKDNIDAQTTIDKEVTLEGKTKLHFYDEDDRIRGCIDSTNRKGEKECFPFVSISIAVVTNEFRPIRHIGEVSAIAAEIKKRVKSMPGSNYYKDLRGSKGS